MPAMFSGSRGKGSRRGPWRHGGKKKQRQPTWPKQAMHASDDAAALGAPLASLSYGRYRRWKPATAIYRLDQALARAGIAYAAEHLGRWDGFRIQVAAEHRARAQEIIEALEIEGEPGK